MNGALDSDFDRIPLSAKSRIDEVCLMFEDAWRTGEPLSLEDLLDKVPEDERAVLFAELLLVEVEYRLRDGGNVLDDEYRTRFPEYAHIIDRVFRRAGVEQPPPPYEAGQRIGRYEIRTLIGRGGFGAVYAAWDAELERTVAIKTPRAAAVASPDEVERMLAEARAAGKLQHRAIVPVYDVVHDEHGNPLIIMEHVQGVTLREKIRSERLPCHEVLRLLIEIAEAIDYAHQEGFVHRDLEPGNIALDDRGAPRILDFGLALHVSVQSSRAGESAGSLAYMSPEQVRGESDWLDGRADIWALGVMLYEMLTGQCPFHGDNLEQLLEEILGRAPRPPRQIDNAILPELERVCLKCLEKQATERYATARDFASDLRSVQAMLESPEDAMRGEEKRDSNRPARRLVLLATATLLVAGSVSLGWWFASVRNASRTPTEAHVDLRIWDSLQSQGDGKSIREREALPLRPGDLVRLEARLSESLYTYLLWVDSKGGVSPVYPWIAGDWSQRPEDDQPVTQISLPAAGDQAWKVEDSPNGIESVVVLARNEPLPREFELLEALGPLRPQTGPGERQFVELKNGRFQRDPAGNTRSVNLTETESIHDAVLANQQQISDRLGEHFSFHYSINFPVRGTQSGEDSTRNALVQ